MRRHVSVALLALAGLTACTPLGLWLYEEPTIDGVATSPGDELSSDASMKVMFDVLNPNEFDLDATRVEVSVEVDGRSVGRLEVDTAIALRPGRPTRVTLAVLPTDAAAAKTMRGLRRGSPRYAVTGRVTLGSPIGERKVRFSARSAAGPRVSDGAQ